MTEIIHNYNLEYAPNHIFYVDEKGVSPNHTPPSVVGITGYRPPGVTSGLFETTTIIGFGIAAGVAIPPYLFFAGKRWYDSLLDGSVPGVTGTMSDTGWSNAIIFGDYLENQFLKYVPWNSAASPILLLRDGHTTHVSLGFTDWTTQHHITFFLLALMSHILQPLDVSCYGPFQKMYDHLCHKRMRLSSSVITRYNICELTCGVYQKALSADDLMSGFRKTGIFPCNSSILNAS